MEFLAPLHITQYRLSIDIAVPPRRINEIVLWKRGITADTALRLGRYFGTSAEFWLNLQMHFELERARKKIAQTLERIPPSRNGLHHRRAAKSAAGAVKTTTPS